MITDSNQACFAKMTGRKLHEGRVKEGDEGLYLQLNDLKKVEGTNYRLKVTRLAEEVFP